MHILPPNIRIPLCAESDPIERGTVLGWRSETLWCLWHNTFYHRICLVCLWMAEQCLKMKPYLYKGIWVLSRSMIPLTVIFFRLVVKYIKRFLCCQTFWFPIGLFFKYINVSLIIQKTTCIIGISRLYFNVLCIHFF